MSGKNCEPSLSKPSSMKSTWYSKPSKKKRKTSKKRNRDILVPRRDISPSRVWEHKIPKVEDILKRREELKKMEEMDKLVKERYAKFLSEQEINLKKSPKKEERKVIDLNCKHLTMQQLEDFYKKHLGLFDGILNGTIYNERHELFKKQEREGGACSIQEDLRLSDCPGAFTAEQLIHIVTLFRERFDNGNIYKYSDYYFKVLLPEFCLQVFMDHYNYTKEEALESLSHLPVPNLLEY